MESAGIRSDGVQGAAAARGPGRRFARIMPIVFVTYSLAFVDRVNYSFGAAAGMARDLGMTERTSALLGALFFFGYFIFQAPGARYAEHRSARRVIFWALLLWGGLSALTGCIGSLPFLMADRFCLGLAEGVVMPALLVFLTHWFSEGERSRANALLILGNPATLLWASAISGVLVEKVGWRLMFILEGAPSIIWAFVWHRTVRDWPHETDWAGADEGAPPAVSERRPAGGLEIGGRLAMVARRGDVRLLCLLFFFWSSGFYGYVLWLPKTIHDSAAVNLAMTGLLSACPHAVGIVLLLGASVASDRLRRRKAFIWPFLLVGTAAFFGSVCFAPRSFAASYACLLAAGGCLYAGFGPFFAMIPELVPAEIVPETFAAINSCGALGSFLGAYAIGWLNAATGSSQMGFALLAGSLGIASACMLALKAR